MSESREVIYHAKEFGVYAMVVWGGDLTRKNGVTVHLPYELRPHGASMGATRACQSDNRTRCAWTYVFGFTEWKTSRLCKRCFPNGLPNERYKPEKGWITYQVKDPWETIAATRVIEI